MTGPYTNWIMDLMSKDIYKYRRENEQLKEMISKFISGEYSKEKLIQEYQILVNKNKKDNSQK
jgi:hypothetical protein